MCIRDRVLLVDARNGVVEQTIRHLTVAKLLGVRTVILAVNKIDLVDYSQQRFDVIRTEFDAKAGELGIEEPHVVPISAQRRDALVHRPDRARTAGEHPRAARPRR